MLDSGNGGMSSKRIRKLCIEIIAGRGSDMTEPLFMDLRSLKQVYCKRVGYIKHIVGFGIVLLSSVSHSNIVSYLFSK
jgi:hypothetical protein